MWKGSQNGGSRKSQFVQNSRWFRDGHRWQPLMVEAWKLCGVMERVDGGLVSDPRPATDRLCHLEEVECRVPVLPL